MYGDGLDPRLLRIISELKNENLKEKVFDLVNNLWIYIGEEKFIGLSFDESPASRYRHHSYPGGLLEHTLSTIEIARTLCNSVEKIYRGQIDRDLVIAGVLLHDIMKPLTYEKTENGMCGISPLGERLDHITLAVTEMIRKEFSLEIVHIVAASHGESGFVRPRTIEALVCHLADIADSQLNEKVLGAARYLAKEICGETRQIMNAAIAFDIVKVKASEGWEGLRKMMNRRKK